MCNKIILLIIVCAFNIGNIKANNKSLDTIPESNIYQSKKACDYANHLREASKYDEALKQLYKADSLTPFNDSIQSLIKEVKHEKATRLVIDGLELKKSGDCRNAFRSILSGNIIFKEIGDYSEIANETPSYLQQALNCAKKYLFVNIENNTDYDLELYNQSLLTFLRKKIIDDKSNQFLDVTDELKDADYILTFKIESKNEYRDSTGINVNNYCSCRQNTIFRPPDPNLYITYSYFVAPFTVYTQTATYNLKVSFELRTSANVIISENFADLLEVQWKNKFWRSDLNINNICLCPPTPLPYWYNSFLQPRYVKDLLSNRENPPAAESIFNERLDLKFNSWLKDLIEDNVKSL